MPILRYFVFVGGTLLALLFICDALLPHVPLPSVVASDSERPVVRIRSERKWPERVVMDTSIPMVAPVTVANADAVPPAVAAADAKARVREAFAQAGVSEAKPTAIAQTNIAQTNIAQTNMAPTKVADVTVPKSDELKVKPKHKARAQASRPMMLVAQQPQSQYGWFRTAW